MKITRRDWLKCGAAGGVLGGATLLGGCSAIVRRAVRPDDSPAAAPPSHDDPIVRLLSRVGFGPAPGDAMRVANLGVEKYVDDQLSPDDGDETILTLRLHGVEVFETSAVEMRDVHVEPMLRGLQQAAILRAVYSRHQLR